MSTAQKYLMQAPANRYRLTLTTEAFALALSRSKPIAGAMA